MWLYPLKRITGAAVAACLEELFQTTKPERFSTDAGKEFVNNDVRRVLRDYNVNHHIAKGRTKCSVAERFNLTIQRLIYMRCRHLNTNDWISNAVLGEAKKIYLNREHRTIKMSPKQAELPENQAKIRRIYFDKYQQAEKHRKLPKFKIGEKVRISILRGRFNRGYHQNFTQETWKISEVLDNLPQPRYKVEDERGDLLDSVLNENEIIRYEPENRYMVEKILKTRKRNGRKEYLIRWLHYDSSFDSWEPAENVTPVRK